MAWEEEEEYEEEAGYYDDECTELWGNYCDDNEEWE